MKRSRVAVAAIGLLVGYTVFSPSRVAAEPILGEESLPAAAPSPQQQEGGDALSLFKAKDYEGALKVLREAVNKNVDLPPAQVIMAQLFLATGMLKEAEAALQQATIDEPGDPEIYLMTGSLALRAREFDKAESLYKKARSLLETFQKSAKRKSLLQAGIYAGFAALAEARQDLPGAQKVLEEWQKAEPKNVAIAQRIAFCLFQQKNIDGALERLRQAAKIAPAIVPEAILAQFYQRIGDQENTKKWMATAVAAAPKNVKLRLAAGQWAFEAGRLDEAQKHAIVATRLDPKSLEAKILQGSIATFQKNYVAAELFFDSAIKQSPGSFPISNNLALVLIEQNDETKGRHALEYAEANVKKYPTSPEAASTLGLVLFRLGRLEDAEKALRTAAPIADKDIDTAYAFACVAAKQGHKSKAKEMLETVLKDKKPAMFRQEAEDLLEELKK
jgi:tetratricopeptide (TPR) repeat protein